MPETLATGPGRQPGRVHRNMRGMDRKLGVLIGLIVLIGALVAVILIGRGSGDSNDSAASGEIPRKSPPGFPEDLSNGRSWLAPARRPHRAGQGGHRSVTAPRRRKATRSRSSMSVRSMTTARNSRRLSWDRNKEAFSFQLGGGQVIRSWDEGVAGMKVGGRRVLVIPPDLGYGPQGSPPTIPGNSTLVFVVDLEDVRANNTRPQSGLPGSKV